ncbi:lipid droplet-associated hydrolase isoform X1 [Hemicordylus capensis]|uniref:lipid droplet-associated hydrolase isoform X1 n=1 Tax=Hemicordylus capensis TaxID=884348 RepID=UPI00230203DF|nr:lipid droplet-associated hydrolase isoform X1 [Hemicordylus capensis]
MEHNDSLIAINALQVSSHVVSVSHSPLVSGTFPFQSCQIITPCFPPDDLLLCRFCLCFDQQALSSHLPPDLLLSFTFCVSVFVDLAECPAVPFMSTNSADASWHSGTSSMRTVPTSVVLIAQMKTLRSLLAQPGIPETDVKELHDVFGLHGQTQHKLNFLRQNVPKDTKLVIIGHSIGCYIALEMMKQALEQEVLRCVMLFPTIERMAQSPLGKICTPLFCQLRYVLYMPIYLATLLPDRVKHFLVRLLNRQKNTEESSLITTVGLLNVGCIANAMYMASQEMREVVERDSTTIRQHLKKLTFYYGTGDMWCPMQYYEEMKMEFPDGDIRLCEKGISHAFVLESSKEMAVMVADWLQEDLARL